MTVILLFFVFFFSSRRRHTRCALVTGVQTCALPISRSRYERFRNMNKAFSVASPLQLRGLHVLLVDDVITTGATLTACAASILQVEGTKIGRASCRERVCQYV